MALIIAGERSGVGKTTVTLSLLASLAENSSQTVQSFKVGPDYIDPMFHQALTGRPCRNLDVVLTSEAYVKSCFAHHANVCDLAVIEGVMGLFDGANDPHKLAPWDWGSTAHIAALLQLPILLVVNAGGTSRSIAALVRGYQTFAPELKIAGVVLNRVSSPRHLELLTQALEQIQMPVLGVFYRQAEITIPDRHLGLVPTGELTEFELIKTKLAELGKTSFHWEKLWLLLGTEKTRIDPRSADKSTLNPGRVELQHSSSPAGILQVRPSQPRIRLGVAQDAAFNFYYADNFDILESVGFDLVAWSPLTAATIPEKIHGLYFGGGFPEIFAAQLSQNQSLRNQLRQVISQGLPTYAECGGLMYLCQAIVDFEHREYPMVGIIPSKATMDSRLTLGYRQARRHQLQSEIPQNLPSAWITESEVLWGHEFHRSSLNPVPTNPLYGLRNYDGGNPHTEGWRIQNLIASYVHLHFGGSPQIPQRWWQQCLDYQRQYPS